MKIDIVIDYAMPLMRIERMAAKVHDLCSRRKYEEARELAVQLTAESRLLVTTLRHMSEKEKEHEHTQKSTGRPTLVHSASGKASSV